MTTFLYFCLELNLRGQPASRTRHVSGLVDYTEKHRVQHFKCPVLRSLPLSLVPLFSVPLSGLAMTSVSSS